MICLNTKGSQDEESNNNFNILAKIKHLLAGYIFCTRLWTKLLAQYFSSFIDIAISALFDFITRPVMKKSESIKCFVNYQMSLLAKQDGRPYLSSLWSKIASFCPIS